jgi:hypothetical protein
MHPESDQPTPISDEALAAYDKALESPLPVDLADDSAISELREFGLLEETEDGEWLAPVDPRIAEVRVVGDYRRQAQELELRATAMEQQLTPLTEKFLATHDELGSSLQYISGISAIQDFVAQHSLDLQHEMLTAQPGGGRSEATLRSVLPLVLDQLARGVRIRTLYQHTARFSEPTKRYVEAVANSGGEVRSLDEFFDRLIIMDRELAILPAQPDNKVALAVTDKALVTFLVGVFDRCWQRALPFVSTPAAKASAEVSPDIHTMIKRLLVEGLTDSAIARRIGTSERTYHTHLARIRAELGAESRTQLGYLIAKQEMEQDLTDGQRCA